MCCGRRTRVFQKILTWFFLLFIGIAFSAAESAKPSASNPFATDARFAVDSEADPSRSAIPDMLYHPERLHPRLSLSSVVATTTPADSGPNDSLVEITFYSFAFTQGDMAIARKGDTQPLFKKSDAIQNKNAKSGKSYNGGGWAIVQLTLDEHRQIREIRMTVPGYSVLLTGREFQIFLAEYKFDGKKLRLHSKGSNRVDNMPVGVASFTIRWDMNLAIPVFAKRAAKT
jgi:hypothetical protein